MTRSTLTRRGIVALLTAAATAFGMLSLAAPAQADSVIQVSAPAGPVEVNEPYTVTVDLPNSSPEHANRSAWFDVALSGAAATVTSAQPSDSDWSCDFAAGTSGTCWHLTGFTTPVSITLTVTPTEGGTVTTRATALSYSSQPIGTATADTQVSNPTPAFPFTGFYAPVHNPPAVNSVNAGRSIPVKFSLDGDKGLDVLADGSPSSQQTACDGTAAEPVETGTVSTSGLTYDAASDTYTYVWKTDRAWAGTCRTLHLKLSDGSDHVAHFEFR
ncbi:PxKF domain-containing protein [Streptomyces solaniscabiei]|uniref:PxKF domain-containing protein n=1 Tax=Streptomyces solaniscabiei TaxID=2683255 RepID=UPI001CE30145|nr:PxKF domain-containing protein [Streptomyces solaniscabiei]